MAGSFTGQPQRTPRTQSAFCHTAFLCLLTAVAVTAQRTPSESTEELVRIDVIAVDARGAFVPNLTRSDFELREDGKPQTIDEVRDVRGSTVSRLFAIYLDEYHVGKGLPAARARAALARFVDEEIGPDDLFVVMKPLDSLLTIRMTGDRERARQAIASFEGRRGDHTPQNDYERSYMAGSPARVEAARMQVSVSALNALAAHLGSLSDLRKTLVVVTERLTSSSRSRGQEYLPTVETLIRAANRARVSVYPIDPRASTGADAGVEDERAGLRNLAGETQGQLITSDGDLSAAPRRLGVDSSTYYLLTYRASHPADGEFHDVEVRVNRPGVQVRARNGYWAPSPDEAFRAAALAPSPSAARIVDPPTRISPLVRPWFGLSRGSAGKTRVTFVWEPSGRIPGDRAPRIPVRLMLTAVGADGAVLFEGPVRPSGSAGGNGSPARAVFDAAPGRIRLRMKIEGDASQELDTDVREVSVRDLGGVVSIGTPEVLRARTAREFRALDSDAAPAPVASREFSRRDRLLIRIPVYGSGGVQPTLAAKLRSRMGQTMRDLTVQPSPDGANQIDIPLAGLAAGEYLIELTATSPAGEAKDLVGFRVTS